MNQKPSLPFTPNLAKEGSCTDHRPGFIAVAGRTPELLPLRGAWKGDAQCPLEGAVEFGNLQAYSHLPP